MTHPQVAPLLLLLQKEVRLGGLSEEEYEDFFYHYLMNDKGELLDRGTETISYEEYLHCHNLPPKTDPCYLYIDTADLTKASVGVNTR